MELNPSNAFGELLLDLIEAQYGDIDTGLTALMQTTGLGEQEVVAMINGDIIVDSEALLSNVLQAFPDADAEDVSMVIDVAVGVDEADQADLQAQVAEAEQGATPDLDGAEGASAAGGGFGGEGGAGGAGGEGGFNRSMNAANFQALSNQLAIQQNQIAQLTQGISNYSQAEGLRERLRDIDDTTSTYVERGMLPPSYKAMLVGNFKNDKERLAKFANVAAQNNVDVNTMLFATEYAAGLMADASQFVEFSDYSLSDQDVAIAEFSANLDAVVAQDYDAIFN
jgi:hypothetical protein